MQTRPDGAPGVVVDCSHASEDKSGVGPDWARFLVTDLPGSGAQLSLVCPT